MSAIRTNTGRRTTRVTVSSPYRRPPPQRRGSGDEASNRQKGWGISSFLLGLFGRSTPQSDDDEDSDHDIQVESPSDQEERRSPVQDMPGGREDREPSVVEISPPPLPQSQHTEPPRTPSLPIEDEQTPASKLRQVSEFLAEHGNRPLNRVEVAGLVSLLEGSVQDEQREPFRFSPSPLTAVPRDPSPSFNFNMSSTSAPTLTAGSSGTQAHTKSLARNPNGVYRWQGAGSARPRTRYQSPGFGPSRSMPIRMKLTTEAPTTDKKRRRVGSDPEASTAQRASTTTSTTNGHAHPAPESSSPPATSFPSRPNVGPPPPSRLRTNNLKPTAPTVPSPLRQAWNQTDSPPPPPQPASASKPTRAANIMSELIKDTIPPPKPDFSNPYEAANPVPAKPATRRPVTKRTRPVAIPRSEPKIDERPTNELSPQKIIEATIPKGSKRSRPPPELSSDAPMTSSSDPVPPRRSNRLKSPEPPVKSNINGFARLGAEKPAEDVVSVDEDESPNKKQKTATTGTRTANGRVSMVTIEEVEDIEMPPAPRPHHASPRPAQPAPPIETEEPQQSRQRSISPTPTTGPTSPVRNHFGLKSSVPKAPSKLRYSFQADGDSEKGEEKRESEASANAAKLFAPPPPPSETNKPFTFPTAPTPLPSVLNVEPTPPPKPTLTPEERAKASAVAMVADELLTFSFNLLTSSPGAGPGPSSQKNRDAAKAAALTSPPLVFDFSATARTASPAATPSPKPQANGVAHTSVAPPSTTKPSGGFNFAAAGMKAPTSTSGDQWECSTCMLKNPASTTEKCTVCDAPRPKPASAPATTGFNWAAAGLKKPAESGNSGSWTCSTCMLANPPSATTKCSVCDAPR